MKTKKYVPLVPDYVPSNRDCSQVEGCTGALVYSTTVNHPGKHTFSCDYLEDRQEPKIILAIGPNYVFEFFRLVWKMRWSILGTTGVLCISCTIALVCGVIALLGRKKTRIPAKKGYPDE
jgi:hypothetical protein